jgi:hypothetical protein
VNQTYVPTHRAGDPIPISAELVRLGEDHDVAVRRTGTDPDGPAHYVATASARDGLGGDVLVAMSPAAAAVLSQIVLRFTTVHHGPEVGLEDYDPAMWQHVAVDLLRHKALAGPLPAGMGSYAKLFGGPRSCLVSVR